MKNYQQPFKAHPWHGVPFGNEAPEVVTAYIEIVPTDVVKYEVDKATGHLKIDRPQKYSNQCPALYGFVPQTYCGDAVGRLASSALGRSAMVGDGDPLDICVMTDRVIGHGDILVRAIPIGGIRMIEENEADDKIIAVLVGDAVFGDFRDIAEFPKKSIDRLRHYFLTYKEIPGEDLKKIEITGTYDATTAKNIIMKAREDYLQNFT